MMPAASNVYRRIDMIRDSHRLSVQISDICGSEQGMAPFKAILSMTNIKIIF